MLTGPPTRALEADGGARGGASRATIFELAMPDQASSTAQETGASGLETLRLSNGYVRHVAGRVRTPTAGFGLSSSTRGPLLSRRRVEGRSMHSLVTGDFADCAKIVH